MIFYIGITVLAIINIFFELCENNARGLFDLPWLANMAQCVEIEIDDIRAVGRDWRITARVAAGG